MRPLPPLSVNRTELTSMLSGSEFTSVNRNCEMRRKSMSGTVNEAEVG
jgi:hypothetical protein